MVLGVLPDCANINSIVRAQTDYRGRRMHPTIERALRDYFLESNLRLCKLLNRDFHWDDPEK